MTPKQIEKELNRQAVMFEEACMKGFQAKAVKFETFCEEWFEEYAKPNLRNTTYDIFSLCTKPKQIYDFVFSYNIHPIVLFLIYNTMGC